MKEFRLKKTEIVCDDDFLGLTIGQLRAIFAKYQLPLDLHDKSSSIKRLLTNEPATAALHDAVGLAAEILDALTAQRSPSPPEIESSLSTSPPTFTNGKDSAQSSIRRRKSNMLARGSITSMAFQSARGYGLRDALSTSIGSIYFPPVRETAQARRTIDDDGFKLINNYTMQSEIGRGTQGKVKLARNNDTGELVAIKIISMKKAGLREEVKLLREIAVMKKMCHNNVVRLYEVIRDEDRNKLYLVMQYVKNGSVAYLDSTCHCDALPEGDVRSIIYQTANALMYMHRHHVIHHDIKPQNLLIDESGHVYVADFGVSEMADLDPFAELVGSDEDESATIINGTPAFMAPELFMGEEQHGEAGDVWALGVTMFYLLFGELPFASSSLYQLRNAILNDPVRLPCTPAVSTDALDVVRRLLEKRPHERITLQQLKDHPWLNREKMKAVATVPTTPCVRRNRPAFETPIEPPIDITEADLHMAVTVLAPVSVFLDEPRPPAGRDRLDFSISSDGGGGGDAETPSLTADGTSAATLSTSLEGNGTPPSLPSALPMAPTPPATTVAAPPAVSSPVSPGVYAFRARRPESVAPRGRPSTAPAGTAAACRSPLLQEQIVTRLLEAARNPSTRAYFH